MTIENNNQILSILFKLEKIAVFVFLFSLMIPLSTPIGPVWSRIYFWDLGLFAMLALWAVRVCVNDRQAIKLTFLDGILITFILWLCICNFFGPRPTKSLEAWLLWVRACFIYLYFSRNLGRKISVRSFLIMLLVLIFFEGSLGVFQQATKSNFGQMNQYFGTPIKNFWLKNVDYIRSSGTFINTNILAAWMLVLLPILGVWRFYETKNSLKKIVDGIFILGMLSAVCTLSRSKLFTLTVGLIIILIRYRNHFSIKTARNNPRYFFPTILILISCGVLFSGIIGGIWQRFDNMDENLKKKKTQIFYAIEIMKANPFLGKGQGNYAYQLNEKKFPYLNLEKYKRKLKFYDRKRIFYEKKLKRFKKNSINYTKILKRYEKYDNKHKLIQKSFMKKANVACHNIPLKIGAESGVVGLIIFIGFCLYVFFQWLRVIQEKKPSYNQAIRGGALTSMLCVFIDMQWNTTMTHHSFLPLFFVILGLAFSSEIYAYGNDQ